MFQGAEGGAKVSPRNLVVWFLMCFQAGAVNAGALLACGRFVSHVTGFYTFFGTSAARGDWGAAASMLSVPFFFLGGAFVSALLVDARIHAKKRPLDWVVAGLVCVFLLLVMVTGLLNGFGAFNESYAPHTDYAMLTLLAGACGLQNALVTSASGAVVRTTHMTGLTTDLGMGLARMFSRQFVPELYERERTLNMLRAGSIASFAVGGWIASVGYIRAGYGGFALPAAVAFLIFCLALSSRWKKA